MIDGNFGNVSVGVFVFESRESRKTVVTAEFSEKQSAAFMKIQGQTYQVIGDAD